MASPAQIQANRLNALKSTGPRTEAGKSVSRMNALQHGIDAHASVLPGEDPDAYQALADEYRQRFAPSTPEQHFLVDTLIQSDWNRRRYGRLHGQLTARLIDAMDPADRSVAALFLPDNPASRALGRLISHFRAAESAWFRALKELERIQQRDAVAAIEMPPVPTPAPQNWLRSEPVAQASRPVQGEHRSPEPNLALRL
jgi:hypothetical protein